MKKRVEIDLPVLLTTDEKLQFGNHIAQQVKALEIVQENKKAASSSFKAQEEHLNAAIGRYSEMVRSGVEYRLVECELFPDYSLGMVSVVRLDTGETVNTRALTKEERQTQMEID